jgi:hypothetical protein
MNRGDPFRVFFTGWTESSSSSNSLEPRKGWPRESGVLAHQRAFVADLERKGRDTSKAQALLDRLEQEQAAQMADRDSLLSELGK